MRLFSMSTIALPPEDHGPVLHDLAGFGIAGLEVAPTRAWSDVGPDAPTAAAVERYRRHVEAASLRVVGLHSLFYGARETDGMSLLAEGERRAATLAYLDHLAAVCRDLGGRTLVFGSPPARRRGDLTADAARDRVVAFFGDLCARISGYGVCYCLEPLGPDETDFCNRLTESVAIARAVGHPALRCQVDAKALAANGEAALPSVREAGDLLVHCHANEPGLAPLAADGPVAHEALGSALRDIGYDGWVSLEMREPADGDLRGALARSSAVLKEAYW